MMRIVIAIGMILSCWIGMVPSASAEFVYAGLAGGVDRGDGAALPALGFKMAFDPKAGVEMVYGRGGIQSEGSYRETEQVLAFNYRVAQDAGSWAEAFFGAGIAALNTSSESEGKSENATIGAFSITTGVNIGFFKVGIDSFLGLVPGTVPLYALGVRNFWYLGFEITL